MDYTKYWEKAIDFGTYMQNFERELTEGTAVTEADKLPINMQRIKRILKTMVVSEDDLNKLSALNEMHKWIVISEHWCGDSAQILPAMYKVAEASNGKIELRIIYRDVNPEFMDAHLTNGGRSIPKLIQLNSQFEVTGMYGPRPEYAMQLVKRLKSDSATASTYAEEVHKWYAQDKQQSILKDLLQLVKNPSAVPN